MRKFDSEGFCEAGFDKNGLTRDKKVYKAFYDTKSPFYCKGTRNV